MDLEYFMTRTSTNCNISRHISNFVASRLFSVGYRWLSACLNFSLEFDLWNLRDETYGQKGGKVQGNWVLSTLSPCAITWRGESGGSQFSVNFDMLSGYVTELLRFGCGNIKDG
jgi:hypothetical protein